MASSIGTSTIPSPVGGGSSANDFGGQPGTLVAISNDGTAFVLWCDGSNIKYSSAVSPYSTWTTNTLIATIGGGPRWEAAIRYEASDDSILAVVQNAAGNMVAYPFTYSSATHSWSAGTASTVLSGGGASNGGGVIVEKDPQGRFWAIFTNNTGVLEIYTSANGTSWSASMTITLGSGNTTYAAAQIGNYLVVVYADSVGNQKYTRLDTSVVTLGAWSTAGTAGGTGFFFDNTCAINLKYGSNSKGVLVASVGDTLNVLASTYDATANTWGASVTIGSANADTEGTLAQAGGNVYALWSKSAGTNNFSLVYKKWTESTDTWDAANTQLEASGSNIQWANAGYNTTANLLAFAYSTGTASPWTLNFDTKSFGSTSLTWTAADAQTLAESSTWTETWLPTGETLSISDIAAYTLPWTPLAESQSLADSVGLNYTFSPADAQTLTETSAAANTWVPTNDTLATSDLAAYTGIWTATTDALTPSDATSTIGLAWAPLTDTQSLAESAAMTLVWVLSPADSQSNVDVLTATLSGLNWTAPIDAQSITDSWSAVVVWTPLEGTTPTDALATTIIFTPLYDAQTLADAVPTTIPWIPPHDTMTLSDGAADDFLWTPAPPDAQVLTDSGQLFLALPDIPWTIADAQTLSDAVSYSTIPFIALTALVRDGRHDALARDGKRVGRVRDGKLEGHVR